MRFALLLHAPEAADAAISDDDMAPFIIAFDQYGRSLDQAGVLVSADVLQPVAATTTVTLRDGGVDTGEGPLLDVAEKLSAIFVVDVADADAALDWAQKCPGAQYGVVEIRPVATGFVDGRWQS
jgi:hypothetical protein